MGFATVDSIAQYTAKIKNAIFYCRIFLFLSVLYIPHYSNNKTILQQAAIMYADTPAYFLTHFSPAATPAPAKYEFHPRLQSVSFPQKTQTDDMLIPFIQM